MTSQPKTPRCDLAQRSVRLSLNHTACKGAQLSHRLCPKQSMQSGTKPLVIGNAGALARYERETQTAASFRKVGIERAAHAVRARAPGLPVLACLLLPHPSV